MQAGDTPNISGRRFFVSTYILIPFSSFVNIYLKLGPNNMIKQKTRFDKNERCFFSHPSAGEPERIERQDRFFKVGIIDDEPLEAALIYRCVIAGIQPPNPCFRGSRCNSANKYMIIISLFGKTQERMRAKSAGRDSKGALIFHQCSRF